MENSLSSEFHINLIYLDYINTIQLLKYSLSLNTLKVYIQEAYSEILPDDYILMLSRNGKFE